MSLFLEVGMMTLKFVHHEVKLFIALKCPLCVRIVLFYKPWLCLCEIY